jgi:group I intron endonuclease
MQLFGIIYKITNKHNGKVYIGQTTKSLSYRWSCHKLPSSGSVKLRKAIQKYGPDSFLIEEFYNAFDRRELDRRESELIASFDSIRNGYNTLAYAPNDCVGEKNPFYGKKHSNETRSKIKRARAKQIIKHSLETIEKIRISNTGKRLGTRYSPETDIKPGQHLSVRTEFKSGQVAWNKGIPATEEFRARCVDAQKTKKSVVAIKDGRVIANYPSIRAAARVLGLNKASISRVCRGKAKKAGGYVWQYAAKP